MADDTLAERELKLVKDIGARFAATIENALTVLEVAGRAYELQREVVPVVDAEGNEIGVRVELVRPPGMSMADFNICQDAMKSKREVPFYLGAALGRVDLAHRIAGDRSNAPQQIAALVVKKLDVPKREYPVIDVTVPKEK